MSSMPSRADSIAKLSDLSAFQCNYVLHMVSVREHVYRTHGSDYIVLAENLKVTCLRSRIAAHIYHSVWCRIEDHLCYVWVDSGSWWVKNDHIRSSVLLNKCICKNILHVTCEEVAVCDAVVFSVYLCISDCFRNIFDTDDLRSLA